jgi:hypothetical protein
MRSCRCAVAIAFLATTSSLPSNRPSSLTWRPSSPWPRSSSSARHISPSASTRTPRPAAANQPPSILAFSVAYGYAVGWNPTCLRLHSLPPCHGQPPSRRPYRGIGVFTSCTVFEIVGAGVATLHGTSTNPRDQLQPPARACPRRRRSDRDRDPRDRRQRVEHLQRLNVLPHPRHRTAAASPPRTPRPHERPSRSCYGLAFKAQVRPGSHKENLLLAISYWITSIWQSFSSTTGCAMETTTSTSSRPPPPPLEGANSYGCRHRRLNSLLGSRPTPSRHHPPPFPTTR